MSNESNDDIGLFDTLNDDFKRNVSPWSDIGVIAIALYLLFGWVKVAVWLIEKFKLKIPLIVFFTAVFIHGLVFMFSKDYKQYLIELGRQQDEQRAREAKASR